MSLKVSARPVALLLALTSTLAACGSPPAADTPATVDVGEILCRPTPNGRPMTGCYLTLTAAVDDRLVAVSSPYAAEAQIHEMRSEGGIMRMSELPDGLRLPAGRPVTLRPGSDHLMLMGLSRQLAVGDTVPLVLTFEKAPPLGVRAVVAIPVAPAS